MYVMWSSVITTGEKQRVSHDTICHDKMCYDKIHYDTIRYDTIWYLMVWYDTIHHTLFTTTTVSWYSFALIDTLQVNHLNTSRYLFNWRIWNTAKRQNVSYISIHYIVVSIKWDDTMYKKCIEFNACLIHTIWLQLFHLPMCHHSSVRHILIKTSIFGVSITITVSQEEISQNILLYQY